jgi:NADH-quinone oxidoreductase subunit H
MATSSDLGFFLLVTIVKVAIVLWVLLTAIAYLTWLERKVIGHIQSRWGPYLVGPHGLLQPLADGVKFLFKEDIMPADADRLVYWLAPFIAMVTAFLSIAVIPFGESFELRGHVIPLQITDLNVGLLFVFAVTSLGVYSIVLAGWASNSKYPLFGGLRSSAQMISYELALGLGVVGVLMISGTLSLRGIAASQSGFWRLGGIPILPRWNIFLQPVGFLVYFLAAIAETNRVPFDLPEGETELVAGFHTEYSSFKFAMFFMSEYANMVTVSCLATLLFFGGWSGPVFGPGWLRVLLPVFWFSLKVFCFLFFYIWVRGTLPRFRYDQLMAFGWKFLVPLGLANILVTSFVLAWIHS